MQGMEPYIGLLIQVPLVGVFIWFALKLVSIFMESLEKRDQQWQNFLREQREATTAAINAMGTRMGEEMKALSREVYELRGMIEKE